MFRKVVKMTSKSGWVFLTFCVFLLHGRPFYPQWARGPLLAPFWSKIGDSASTSYRFLYNFQYIFDTFSAVFPATTPPPKPMDARARWTSRRKSLQVLQWCPPWTPTHILRQRALISGRNHCAQECCVDIHVRSSTQPAAYCWGAAMVRRRRLQYIYISAGPLWATRLWSYCFKQVSLRQSMSSIWHVYKFTVLQSVSILQVYSFTTFQSLQSYVFRVL